MKFLDFIVFFALGGIVLGLGIWGTTVHPQIGCAAFCSSSLLMSIAVIALNIRKFKVEPIVYLFLMVIIVGAIYVYVTNDINIFTMEQLFLILKISGLLIGLAVFGILLNPRKRK